jgi:hypothetical protein
VRGKRGREREERRETNHRTVPSARPSLRGGNGVSRWPVRPTDPSEEPKILGVLGVLAVDSSRSRCAPIASGSPSNLTMNLRNFAYLARVAKEPHPMCAVSSYSRRFVPHSARDFRRRRGTRGERPAAPRPFRWPASPSAAAHAAEGIIPSSAWDKTPKSHAYSAGRHTQWIMTSSGGCCSTPTRASSPSGSPGGCTIRKRGSCGSGAGIRPGDWAVDGEGPAAV